MLDDWFGVSKYTFVISTSLHSPLSGCFDPWKNTFFSLKCAGASKVNCKVSYGEIVAHPCNLPPLYWCKDWHARLYPFETRVYQNETLISLSDLLIRSWYGPIPVIYHGHVRYLLPRTFSKDIIGTAVMLCIGDCFIVNFKMKFNQVTCCYLITLGRNF